MENDLILVSGEAYSRDEWGNLEERQNITDLIGTKEVPSRSYVTKLGRHTVVVMSENGRASVTIFDAMMNEGVIANLPTRVPISGKPLNLNSKFIVDPDLGNTLTGMDLKVKKIK